MSVNATRFAWECDLSKTTKRSAKRLVLLALADRANKENTCFPSIARVVKDTEMDRKTVMNTINDLITLGLVSDTGDRKGGTNQVRVLKINVVEQESYPQDGQNSSNKRCEISKETVVNLPINGVEFPSNGGKFGTQNLKEPLIKSKINLKSEKALKINENEVKSKTDDLCDQNTLNTAEDSVYNAHTSDSSDVKSVSATYVHEQQNNAVKSNESVVQQPKKQSTWSNHKKSDWIPKHLYAEHMKQKRLDEQQNKEPFTPKSMIKSWEEGTTGNPNATKGIPEHLLNNPVIANMLKKKGKHTQKQCVSQSEDVTTMKAMSEEHSIDSHKQQENTPSLSNLMKGCFDSGVTDGQEKLYSMKMNQQHFVEDY